MHFKQDLEEGGSGHFENLDMTVQLEDYCG